jgi:hypothetical protein
VELVLGLLRNPLERTAADTSRFNDRALITAVWRAMLAEALSRFGPDIAVTVSGFLPELHSADPREEEPLRTEAAGWVAGAARLAGQPAPALPMQKPPAQLVEAAVRAVARLLPPGQRAVEDIAAVFAPDPR